MEASPLNEAERRVQSRFRFGEWIGLGLILAIIPLFAWQVPETSNRFPMPPRSVALHAEPLAMDAAGVTPLHLAGAWRLTAPDPRFGGISALAIDRGRFVALSDSGILYRFAIPGRSRQEVVISELPGGPGSPDLKENRDSESLARDPQGRGWWIGFETRNQIWLYDRSFGRALGHIDFGEERWPVNLGTEAMLADPGRLTLVPELAHEVVDVANGKAVSRPLRDVGSNISDMVRLPDGEMLILLRDLDLTGFHLALGVLVEHPDGWRVERRVPLHVGTFANLEAMTVERLPGGGVRLWLMTDDNFQPPLTTMLIALDLPSGRWRGRG